VDAYAGEVEQVMKTETISAASHAEVLRKVADWKTAHPKARIMQEDAPLSLPKIPSRLDWLAG
jgi:hypothetical protein